MERSWSEDFFDAEYLKLWGGFVTPERTAREVDGLWSMLGLSPGVTVLDAPCGFGRIARALAIRGATVLGVDRSDVQLNEAECLRGDVNGEALRYVQHDLRTPIPSERGFDVALNLYSSIGYGTEGEDLAVLSNLREAVRSGGRVVLESSHRDGVVLGLARTQRPAVRLEDGTLMVEEPRFDPIRGRMETVWHWSGPRGAGSKRASLRVYTVSEMVALLENAGFRLLAVHAGLSTELFRGDPAVLAGRVALVAEKP